MKVHPTSSYKKIKEMKDYYSEDQYAVSIKKIRRIRACTHQRAQKIKDQYVVFRGLNTPYSRYEINKIFWKISNMVPTPRNPQYAECRFRLTYVKYASDADSASDDDTPVNLHAVVDWELLPTGLGWINVIYRKDNSRKCFTSLREILHLVTRADLMTIYGRVMTFYQDKQAAGVGLVLWGDLKVLMDSPEVNDGSDVWKNQNTWSIQSWKLYSYSGVHVLETVNGLVVHMFVDKKYPLSVHLIERMLDHQLEICQETVGNELTTAVQLIAFLKKQISDSRRPKSLEGCCFWCSSSHPSVACKDFSPAIIRFLIPEDRRSYEDLSRQGPTVWIILIVKKSGNYDQKFHKLVERITLLTTLKPRKEKDPGSFTLPCFISDFYFDNALVDLGASVSVMPLSTCLNLGLGELVHTRLIVELADRTVKIIQKEMLNRTSRNW
ncbi:hypothetical protein Tco_1401564 [Tanacetum coccineum]